MRSAELAGAASPAASSRASRGDDARGRVMDVSQLLGGAAWGGSPARSGRGSGGDEDPRGHIMDISQLAVAVAAAARGATSAASSRGSAADSDPARERLLDMSQLAGMAASASPVASSPRVAGDADPRDRIMDTLEEGLAAAASAPALGADLPPMTTEVTQLPSTAAQWRADTLGSVRQGATFVAVPGPRVTPSAPSGSGPLPPSVAAPRRHDAVPRHYKPHAWDLASLGQEAPAPREAWPPQQGGAGARPQGARGQAPLAGGLEPVGGGGGGFGGARGLLPAGAEAQLVERLAQRFILDRKAPSLERRERSAYQEMLQQVAWNALEPVAAQEVALLLSRRWLAPVSSTEALRAFRRCLHAILCDDRVLDIVELQMASHFSRRGSGARG